MRLYRGEDLNGYKFDPAGLNLTDSQITILKSAIKNQKSRFGCLTAIAPITTISTGPRPNMALYK